MPPLMEDIQMILEAEHRCARKAVWPNDTCNDVSGFFL